jgi:hypothetical protein
LGCLLCDNGIDDDNDGRVDFGGPNPDPGCLDAATDNSETATGLPCDDGSDNDGDGKADFRLSNGDAGCTGFYDVSERGPAHVCDDGLDNDNDGVVDYPAEAQCSSATDGDEAT